MRNRMKTLALVAVAAMATVAATQADTTPDDPEPVTHGVVMVDFAFQPAQLTAARGDVLQFVQQGEMPHNVEFRKTPEGVNLGDLRMGPFVVKTGGTYQIVIDERFEPGTYEIVCTPHEGMGMTARLTVVAGS